MAGLGPNAGVLSQLHAFSPSSAELLRAVLLSSIQRAFKSLSQPAMVGASSPVKSYPDSNTQSSWRRRPTQFPSASWRGLGSLGLVEDVGEGPSAASEAGRAEVQEPEGLRPLRSTASTHQGFVRPHVPGSGQGLGRQGLGPEAAPVWLGPGLDQRCEQSQGQPTGGSKRFCL